MKELAEEKKSVHKKFQGRTVVAIMKFPDDKISLVKRGTVVFKDFWALPGGRVETREVIEQAVVREVKEETGLDVEMVRKLGQYHESGVQDGIEYDYYPACFLVKPYGGKIEKPEEEIEEVRMFDLTEVPRELAFAHLSIIRAYIRTRRDCSH